MDAVVTSSGQYPSDLQEVLGHPVFDDADSVQARLTTPLAMSILDHCEVHRLNKSQSNAVATVVCNCIAPANNSPRISLIQGPPGTGMDHCSNVFSLVPLSSVICG